MKNDGNGMPGSGVQTRPSGSIECDRLIVVDRQSQLLQVVDALGTPGRLPRGLDRGEQQGDQTAMIAMTTRSSISVNPSRPIVLVISGPPLLPEAGTEALIPSP